MSTYVAGSDRQHTYETVGIKEDISDVIGLISPYDTPNYSQFRKTDAKQTNVQWQEDALRPPAANAQVEGIDTVIGDAGLTTMLVNYTQIFEESARVSGTIEAVELYGRASEMDYQVMKKAREVRRDIEYALCGSGQVGAAGSVSVARQLKSMQGLISAATTSDNGGTPRAFAEALVLAVHQATYEIGGDPTQLQVTPSHSIVVANFAYASGRSRDITNESRIVNKVDLYVSPFGELSVVTNKWLRASDAFLLEVDRWYLPQLRPMSSTPLAKTGDNEKRLINCELTVAHENRAASGLITDLTTAGGAPTT
jgi:hypothetical protein